MSPKLTTFIRKNLFNIESVSVLNLFDNKIFPYKYSDIINRVKSFKPNKYATTRNFINGSVSYLSAYVSRGVISTKFILKTLLDKNLVKKNKYESIKSIYKYYNYCRHIIISFTRY